MASQLNTRELPGARAAVGGLASNSGGLEALDFPRTAAGSPGHTGGEGLRREILRRRLEPRAAAA